jgi:hypothetical protein
MSETTGAKPTRQYELFDEDLNYKGEGKTCNKCKVFQPLSNFGLDSGAKYLKSLCRSCEKKQADIRKELRQKYGDPPSDYKCPICLGTSKDVKFNEKSSRTPWVVDHCHHTETFRGWLCNKCNLALGNFSDNIDRLNRAIKYLKKGN